AVDLALHKWRWVELHRHHGDLRGVELVDLEQRVPNGLVDRLHTDLLADEIGRGLDGFGLDRHDAEWVLLEHRGDDLQLRTFFDRGCEWFGERIADECLAAVDHRLGGDVRTAGEQVDLVETDLRVVAVRIGQVAAREFGVLDPAQLDAGRTELGRAGAARRRLAVAAGGQEGRAGDDERAQGRARAEELTTI